MASDIGGPARFAQAAAMDTDLGPTRAIYVGAAGNLSVRMWEKQNTVTFIGVLAGTVIPVQADRIIAATTTIASPTTNIICMW